MALQPDQLRPIASAYRLSQLVYACASLGVPDALAGGAGTIEEVAAAVGAPKETLARLLRAAASEGVLEFDAGRYGLNPFSAQLRSDGEESQRDFVLGWSALRGGYVGFAHLDEAVRTARSGLEVAFGQRFHDYLRTHSDDAARYGAAMESTVDAFSAAADAYDFSRLARVVDVGGGQGSFLVAILRRYPQVGAVLFDLPEVVAGAPARLAPYPTEAARIEVMAGDMFTGVPGEGDAYLFSTVFRCFSDEECLQVLRHVRDQMAPGGCVLALEMVMPEGIPPSPRGLADLQALVVYGGRDRTEQEWTQLLAEAGFDRPTFHPADGPYSLVEASSAG